MNFLTEPEPQRGAALPVIEGITRIVAPNPGAFTYHGTNTYLIEGSRGFTVLDPGPDDPGHLQAILAATGARVARILLSHTHADHLDGLPALRAATGAPACGFHRSADPRFTPDMPIRDGDEIDGWTALHTPGHAADHLCFVRPDGVAFTADHVMSWSTSVVSPPGGNMRQYFASLERMLARDDRLHLPGHGPAMAEPRAYVHQLLDHRRQREAAIVAALAAGPQTASELVEALYVGLAERLKPAAARSVTAHLEKLGEEGRAAARGAVWQAA
jgi:glyoxylase-like metal-dependent hydrolase (beta-lactamase superfamily II)